MVHDDKFVRRVGSFGAEGGTAELMIPVVSSHVTPPTHSTLHQLPQVHLTY